jgi:type I restriction enzyme, R subunit
MAYFETLAYRYDYESAVRDGYLVDYDVVRVRSDIRCSGGLLVRIGRITTGASEPFG